MDRFLSMLRQYSFSRRQVTLASGQSSDFFIDCKQTVLRAEGHALAGEALYRALGGLPAAPVAVAGVELGGCPLASAVSMHSYSAGRPLDAIYVRKESKKHGTEQLIEGAGHLPKGAPVVVLEDVATTGGSTLRAVARLREAALSVEGVIAIVDREQGAAEAFRKEGLAWIALYRRGDFFPNEPGRGN